MTELVHLSLVLLMVNIFPMVFCLWPPFFFLKQDRCLFFCMEKKNQMTSKSRIRFSDVSAGVAEMNALRYLFSYYLQKRPSPQRQRPLQPEVTSPSVLRPGAATPVNDSHWAVSKAWVVFVQPRKESGKFSVFLFPTCPGPTSRHHGSPSDYVALKVETDPVAKSDCPQSLLAEQHR